MPYDREHFAEEQRRSDRDIGKLTPCMNDTKWREVFLLAARHHARFQAMFVRDSRGRTDSLHVVSQSLVGETFLHDPGIGGPCYYREILWIRFPFSVPASFGPIVQRLDSLLADLEKLGQLPFTKTEDYVEIRGYQEPSLPDQQ